MIKKWSLIALFALFPVSIAYAQTTVFAYVKDEKGNAIERAEIDLKESENDVTADKIGYFQIARAKILTPLRDAVRLVDRDHGYIEIATYSEKSGRAEPLRCDINYFIFAALRVLQHFQILRVGQ